MFFICATLTGCESKSTQTQPAAKREVIVAAAADLKFALDEISAAFTHDYPDIVIRPTYGSSGNFFTQLTQKAPFDVYLSADANYPQRLIDQGLAQQDALFRYAIGRIVVWVPAKSTLDVSRLGVGAFTDPSVKKIAIAHPQHAPYGRAAEAALKKLGVYEQIKDRLVFGENVAQTAQFVESGAADAGIIAWSLAVSPKMKDAGRMGEIPANAYPRMDQAGLILPWAHDAAAATTFRDFLLGKSGQEILERYGFLPAGE